MQPLILQYTAPGGVALHGDLYLPPGPGPHPVLIGIPGGGWRFGARAGFRGWGEHLAARGYALFSIDHRRTIHGPAFPQAVQDVRCAMQFLAANAAAHGCDPARMGVLGSSAGAHLGSLAALSGTDYDSPDHPGVRPGLRVMVLAYGTYDLVAHWQNCLTENAASGDDFTSRFMGGTPYDDPDAYHRASPLRRLRYADNKLATFLTWGTEDTAVSPRQSQAFRLGLQQARFPVRDCPVPGAGHFWFSDDPIDDPHGHTAYVAPRILRFLDRFLRDLPLHAGG